ncbi:zinc ribbon domain-containing protein [Erythrobacter sp. GH1-10]|uniref:zinc ribbon domain-containing protein n=1 Tax=Erythrobacter sp. GH1-10 TaxID=3349334 RepID=UPI003877F6B8
MSEESRRFILRPSDVSACFAAIGRSPPLLTLFSDLPPAPLEPPAFVLDAAGDLLLPVKLIFEVLSEANMMFRLDNITSHSSLAAQSAFLAETPEGPYVAVSKNELAWDLALLGKRDALLAALNETLGLAQYKTTGDRFAVDLSLEALAVIAAMADMVTHEQARAVLERRPVNPGVISEPVSVERLAQAIRTERDHPDVRSAITRINLLTGGMINHENASDLVRQGLLFLRQEGLVDEYDAPDPSVLGLVALFQQSSAQSGLTYIAKIGDKVVIDAQIIFHLGDYSLLGLWQFDADGRPKYIRLASIDGAGILDSIDTVIAGLVKTGSDDPSKAGFCPDCGTKHAKDQRFCRACGRDLT